MHPLIRQAQRSPYQGHRGTGFAGPLGAAPWKGGDRLHAVSLGGGENILQAQRSPYQGHRGTGSAGPLVPPPGRGEQTTRQCVWTGVGTFRGGHVLNATISVGLALHLPRCFHLLF